MLKCRAEAHLERHDRPGPDAPYPPVVPEGVAGAGHWVVR